MRYLCLIRCLQLWERTTKMSNVNAWGSSLMCSFSSMKHSVRWCRWSFFLGSFTIQLIGFFSLALLFSPMRKKTSHDRCCQRSQNKQSTKLGVLSRTTWTLFLSSPAHLFIQSCVSWISHTKDWDWEWSIESEGVEMEIFVILLHMLLKTEVKPFQLYSCRRILMEYNSINIIITLSLLRFWISTWLGPFIDIFDQFTLSHSQSESSVCRLSCREVRIRGANTNF